MRPIKGYEGLYSITEDGKIFSHERKINGAIRKGRFLKPSSDGYGYYFVCLQKDRTKKYPKVHRILAETYIPNPKNLECVNHRDGNKQNNDLSNLEWCTQSDNIKHSFSMGLSNQAGSRNANSKLKDSDIERIMTLKKEGLKQIEISKIMNVDPSTISTIVNKKGWKHLN